MAAVDSATLMEKPIVHPMLAIDKSEFTSTFNLSKFLGNVAMGVISALVVRQVLKFIDERKARRSKLA
jgi:hypothetical protein